MRHVITQVIEFCYGHRLLHHAGPCRHLHGHNGRVEIDLAAERLDAKGMVCDFQDVKRLLKDWIDRTFDHRMILHCEDPWIPLLQERGEPVAVIDGHPTAEYLAQRIFHYAKDASLPVVAVRLWENSTSYATYRG